MQLLAEIIMRVLLYFITHLLLIPYPTNAQHKRTIEKEAYEFISQYFAKNMDKPFKLDTKLLLNENEHFHISDYLNNSVLTEKASFPAKLKGVFSEADFDYMRQQLITWKDVAILQTDKLALDTAHLLLNDQRTEREHWFPSFVTYKIAMPLYSRDHQYALFYIENYCGLDCAGGQINILKKQRNGLWKHVVFVLIFIS